MKPRDELTELEELEVGALGWDRFISVADDDSEEHVVYTKADQARDDKEFYEEMDQAMWSQVYDGDSLSEGARRKSLPGLGN